MSDEMAVAKLREGFSWSTLSLVGGSISSAILLFLLIVSLGFYEYGLFSFALTTFALMATLVDLGLTAGTVKLASERKDDYEYVNRLVNASSSVYGLITISIVTCTASIHIVSSILLPSIMLVTEQFFLASLFLPFHALFSMMNSGLRSVQSFKSASVSMHFMDTMGYGIGLILVISGFGYVGAVLGKVIAYVAFTWVSYRFLRKGTNFKFAIVLDRKTIAQAFRIGLPSLGLTSLRSAGTWLMSLLIIFFISVEALGIYSSIIVLIRIPWIFWRDGLKVFLFPMVSSLAGPKYQEMRKQIFTTGIAVSFLVGGLFCVLLILPGYEIASIIFSFISIEYWLLGSLMMVGLFIDALGNYCGQILWGIGKQVSIFKIQLAATSIATIPQIILIFLFGLNGAGFYLVIYYLIIAVGLMITAARALEARIPYRVIGGTLLAAISSLIVTWLLYSEFVSQGWDIYVIYGMITSLSIATYVLLQFLTKSVTMKFIRQIGNLVSGKTNSI